MRPTWEKVLALFPDNSKTHKISIAETEPKHDQAKIRLTLSDGLKTAIRVADNRCGGYCSDVFTLKPSVERQLKDKEKKG